MKRSTELFAVAEDMPAPDAVGWCHHCERWQRFSEAIWTRPAWMDAPVGPPDRVPEVKVTYPMCCECADEPWGMGVWTRDQEMFAACADAHCVSYPGDCEHVKVVKR